MSQNSNKIDDLYVKIISFYCHQVSQARHARTHQTHVSPVLVRMVALAPPATSLLSSSSVFVLSGSVAHSASIIWMTVNPALVDTEYVLTRLWDIGATVNRVSQELPKIGTFECDTV